MACVWGLQWSSKNEMGGDTRYLINENMSELYALGLDDYI